MGRFRVVAVVRVDVMVRVEVLVRVDATARAFAVALRAVALVPALHNGAADIESNIAHVRSASTRRMELFLRIRAGD